MTAKPSVNRSDLDCGLLASAAGAIKEQLVARPFQCRLIDALITSGNGRVLAAPPVAVSESWLTTETQGRAAAIVGGDILLNSELGPPS
ncbi:hypothetical protein F0562_022604 [Nyssa sinensis]|uniref:Uncharacterized protein n=1 Tax=Nyssa sinensis TaxID=561372 RepID=A0A5J5BS92_9ASTE|nr:hypothetical protein F0562_022604 [Nyssa sinensis]